MNTFWPVTISYSQKDATDTTWYYQIAISCDFRRSCSVITNSMRPVVAYSFLIDTIYWEVSRPWTKSGPWHKLDVGKNVLGTMAPWHKSDLGTKIQSLVRNSPDLAPNPDLGQNPDLGPTMSGPWQKCPDLGKNVRTLATIFGPWQKYPDLGHITCNR